MYSAFDNLGHYGHYLQGSGHRVATAQLTLLRTTIKAAIFDVDDDVMCTLEDQVTEVTEVKIELATLNASLLSSLLVIPSCETKPNWVRQPLSTHD